MKKLATLLFLLLPFLLSAQPMMEHKPVKLSRWGIGTGQFSGIAPLGNDLYAVVSDKEPTDGFFTFRIKQNETTGKVEEMSLEGFAGNPHPSLDRYGCSTRDTEGIAYFPSANSVFISGEGDQRILEYAINGQPTGRELRIPSIFNTSNIIGNYGFEALTYCNETQRFWTITESTLKSDGVAAGPSHPDTRNVLRLQSFDNDLLPTAQYAYKMDGSRKEKFGLYYCCGVPAITALPDGRLLVLERELNIPKQFIGAKVECKIFIVQPNESWQIDSSVQLSTLDPNLYLQKELVAHFTTRLNLIKNNFANYEGMCLGRKLLDGRQTILLLNDSQASSGKGPIRVHDFIKVLVF